MSLAPGARLGSYEVVAPIGAGGMGEVYRARDTRLGRDVALKTLPVEVAHDPERLARFRREAHLLASLNHPHIATVHGLEEAGDVLAIAMELVEGRTLAELISGTGPSPLGTRKSDASAGRRVPSAGLALDDALAIARQIAEALEAAHAHGIIHRDLKPSNVKVRDDGTVKVLDFGLAKALDSSQVEPRGFRPGDADAPTLTSPSMTRHGVILGTAAYMAPEQARGKPVDKRADIWAFGCVLYEMLTGRCAFCAEDVSLTLSRVLQTEPHWNALPPNVPGRIRPLLRACLQKTPKLRIRDAGDVLLALDGAFDPAEGASAGTVGPLSVWQRPVPAALGALGLSAVVAIATWLGARADSSATGTGTAAAAPAHVHLSLPSDAPLVFVGEATGGVGQTALTLSPDGRRLAYVGKADATTRLYIRDIDNPTPRPVAGTEGAYAPFFSPDGRWIAFFAGQRLMRASADGAQVSQLAEANWAYGGSWSTDGRIAVVTNDGFRLGIVDPAASILTPVATGGEVGVAGGKWIGTPHWLPESDWVLLTCYNPLTVCAVSVRTGEFRHLVRDGVAVPNGEGRPLLDGSNPRYLAPGFLVYSAREDNVVMGVRFDSHELRVLGQPVQLLRGVRRENILGSLQLAIAASGDAAFGAGPDAVVATLVWAGRQTAATPVHPSFGPRSYGPFRLSPDGRRIVAKVYPQVGRSEIWFFDISTGESQRWTDEGTIGNREPFPGPWIPGSTEVIVSAYGTTNVVVAVDSIRKSGAKPIWSGTDTSFMDAATRDGRLLLDVAGAGRAEPSNIARSRTLYLAFIGREALSRLPADGIRTLEPLVQSSGQQVLADVSPDMRWLTYTSDVGGPYEVWATRLSPQGQPFRVSNGPGELPRWSPQGDGFYYRNGQRWYWVALTSAEDRPFAPPEFFLEGDYLNVAGPEHEVSPDGKRLLLLQGSGERTRSTLDLLMNWRAELERRLPRSEQ